MSLTGSNLAIDGVSFTSLTTQGVSGPGNTKLSPLLLNNVSGPITLDNLKEIKLLSVSGPNGNTLSLDNLKGISGTINLTDLKSVSLLSGVSGAGKTLDVNDLKNISLLEGLSGPAGLSLLTRTAATTGPGGDSGPSILFIDDGKLHQKATQTIGQRFSPGTTIISESIPLGDGSDNTLPVVTATGPNGVKEWIESYSKAPADYATILKQKADAHPEADVINMSFGLSRKTLYDNVYTGIITQQFQNGNKPVDTSALAKELGITDPKLLSTVQQSFTDFRLLAEKEKWTPEVRAEKFIEMNEKNASNLALQTYITKYIDSTMDAPDSTFNKSLQEYQNTTKLLADRGQIVVVAAGNDHGAYWTSAKFKEGVPDQEFNLLAMSRHVISVAATKDNDPNTTIADFSSRGAKGEGKGWKPTISADGVNTNTGVFNENGNEIEDGTSFAAPTVSGAIAEYLKKNPGASFTQIRNDLIRTADDLPGNKPFEEGHGVLDYKEFTGKTTMPDNDDPTTWTTGTSGPGTSGPGTSGPGTSGPSTSGPSTSGPGGASGSSTSGPGTSGPGTSGPGTSGPGTSGPGTSGPGTSGPGTSGPGTSGPGTSGPGTSGPGTPSGPSQSDLQLLDLMKRRNEMFLAVQNLQKDPNSLNVLDRLGDLMGRGAKDGKFSDYGLYELAKLKTDDDLMWKALQTGISGPALTLDDRKNLISFAKIITEVATDEDNISEITGEKRGQNMVFDPGDIQRWLDSHKYWQLPPVTGPGT